MKECFRLCTILATTNKTFIVLIPKTDMANNFNHCRPISLCNFAYNVVAKIIASRLSKAVENLKLPYQGAFVKGIWIAENSVIA